MQNHASTLAAEFKLDAARVAATVALIDEGNTIPFICLLYTSDAADE